MTSEGLSIDKGLNKENSEHTYFYTSESVSEGHPDKICDQVSDAILDAMLTDDPNSRVAVECFATTGMLLIGGEVRTETYCELQDIARDVIKEIGYNECGYKFSADSISVINVINRQSPDIAQGVDSGGAGDQGMMYGYACRETAEYMPAPIMYAHKLVKKLADIRKKSKLMPYLRPDSKSQVTFEYTYSGEILRCEAVVVSTQHDPDLTQEKIREDVINNVIKEVIPSELIDDKTVFHINPTGKFVLGGPYADTGLTGRKIIVDTYGGRAPHGGGAFSGKDATKVDRSGAYAARHIAKNIVAAGVADDVLIQLSYAIGVKDPVSIYVNCSGTSKVADYRLSEFIRKNVDLSPGGIIERLGLRRPIYLQTAAYGHYGKPGLPWEELDMISLFKGI